MTSISAVLGKIFTDHLLSRF